MLERREDGLGCFRAVLHALRITVIVLITGAVIALILAKMLYGCEVNPPVEQGKWWTDNKGYLPVRPMNERKSHGNERAGKNEPAGT